eukprot:68654-Chlamydomonas_euryale.AAC.8
MQAVGLQQELTQHQSNRRKRRNATPLKHYLACPFPDPLTPTLSTSWLASPRVVPDNHDLCFHTGKRTQHAARPHQARSTPACQASGVGRLKAHSAAAVAAAAAASNAKLPWSNRTGAWQLPQ